MVQGPHPGTRRTVELLFSDGCAHVQLALERVLHVLGKLDPDADVELRITRVSTPIDAKRLRLPGSPTVRVDGFDVDVRTAHRYGLHSRLYSLEGGSDHAPPVEWIERALRQPTA